MKCTVAKIERGNERMDKQFFDSICELDELTGTYVLPFDHSKPSCNVQALDAYAKEKGINPSEMTEKEIAQFLVCDDTNNVDLEEIDLDAIPPDILEKIDKIYSGESKPKKSNTVQF